MRKIIVSVIMFVSTFCTAQTSFDHLEEYDDVTSIVITKDMFQLLSKFSDGESEEMEFFNILTGLKELRVFVTNKESTSLKMQTLVNQTIKDHGLTKLMRIKEKNTNVKIYVKATENKDIVNEVVLLVNDKESSVEESTVIVLYGEINMNDLSKIAGKIK